MTNLWRLCVGLSLTVGIVATAACGDGAPQTAAAVAQNVGSAATTLTGTPAITIQGTSLLTFVPANATAKVGDIVQFKNTGSVPHNITWGGPSQLDDSQFLPSSTWDVKFTVAGKYPFQCTLHPGMTANLTITS